MQARTVCTPTPEDRRRSRDLAGFDSKLFDLIVRAGRDPGLTPSDKAVLLAVVAHADENGVCTATDQTLARDSRTSVPTVQRALKVFQGLRAIERAYLPNKFREIRLISEEQSLVVVDVLDSLSTPKLKQHQQHDAPGDCSTESSAVTPERSRPEGDPYPGSERLVELLTAWKVTVKVARELVRDYPERIAPQVEFHPHRNVTYPAASLVAAIRGNWTTDPPRPKPTAKEAKDEARKAIEAERQAALDAQAELNARKRAEEEKVRAFWDGLSDGQKEVFDEEAVEASTHRGEIRSLSPENPLLRVQRAAARWDHVRRKLGLDIRD